MTSDSRNRNPSINHTFDRPPKIVGHFGNQVNRAPLSVQKMSSPYLPFAKPLLAIKFDQVINWIEFMVSQLPKDESTVDVINGAQCIQQMLFTINYAVVNRTGYDPRLFQMQLDCINASMALISIGMFDVDGKPVKLLRNKIYGDQPIISASMASSICNEALLLAIDYYCPVELQGLLVAISSWLTTASFKFSVQIIKD